MSPAISNAFAHMNKHAGLTIENKDTSDIENGLQVGFTVEEMATRTEALLRGIGFIKDFASIVYVIAHGSSSANNPHHGAHDCGACSGRAGQRKCESIGIYGQPRKSARAVGIKRHINSCHNKIRWGDARYSGGPG